MKIIAAGLKVIVVLMAMAACAAMAGRLGPWKALLAWVTISGILCGGSALSLFLQPVGKITPVNYVFGYVVQWGMRFGRGKLPYMVLLSWARWIFLGSAAILAMQVHANALASGQVLTPGQPQGGGVLLMILLALAWMIDGTALFYLLGIAFANGNSGRNGKTLMPVATALLLMILASVALVLFNRSPAAATVALLLAGGPTLLVALGYGLFVLMILGLAGRNARWN